MSEPTHLAVAFALAATRSTSRWPRWRISAALSPQAHIWVQDKLPWVQINDSLPQYNAAYGIFDA